MPPRIIAPVTGGPEMPRWQDCAAGMNEAEQRRGKGGRGEREDGAEECGRPKRRRLYDAWGAFLDSAGANQIFKVHGEAECGKACPHTALGLITCEIHVVLHTTVYLRDVRRAAMLRWFTACIKLYIPWKINSQRNREYFLSI